MTARVGWLEGVTNQVDRLLDYGVPDTTIARRLHIPRKVVERRHEERFPSRPPVIAPARQLELALAAFDREQQAKKENQS